MGGTGYPKGEPQGGRTGSGAFLDRGGGGCYRRGLVDAEDHSAQLSRCRSIAAEAFTKLRRHFVYLSPGAGELRAPLLEAARSLKSSLKGWREPTGTKWQTFWTRRSAFVASELVAEDREEIRRRVAKIVEDLAPEARAVCETLEAALGRR